ncbi:MAG: hypothetical protein QXV37_04645 [Candidatus Jordarchaeaceae archaeon]
MIPNLTALIMLIFGVSVFIFVMLLPALIELKKPRDAGPRIIMGDAIAISSFQTQAVIPLLNMEEEKLELDETIINKIAHIIAFLPNLET